MHAALPISVLIVYAHPLLGLGLARLLASEPGLRVVALDANETRSLESELDDQPDVVILERTRAVPTADLLDHAPHAVVIDVGLNSGPTSSAGPIDAAGPEGLVRAIRSARNGGTRAASDDGQSRTRHAGRDGDRGRTDGLTARRRTASGEVVGALHDARSWPARE